MKKKRLALPSFQQIQSNAFFSQNIRILFAPIFWRTSKKLFINFLLTNPQPEKLGAVTSALETTLRMEWITYFCDLQVFVVSLIRCGLHGRLPNVWQNWATQLNLRLQLLSEINTKITSWHCQRFHIHTQGYNSMDKSTMKCHHHGTFLPYSNVSKVWLKLSDQKSRAATELKEIFVFCFCFPGDQERKTNSSKSDSKTTTLSSR